MRRFTRAALRGLHAGTLRQRAERLADIIAHPEPWIARIVARILRGYRRFRRAYAPLACPPPRALAAPVAAADTS